MWREYEGGDFIPVEQWGRDHWSTLAYLETCAVDGHGLIDNRRMRCNPRLHRRFAHSADGSNCPTRTQAGDVQRHDDGSCLEDIVAAGLVRAWWRLHGPAQMIGGGQAKIELTGEGLRIAAALRMHKARGGCFSDFDPAPMRVGADCEIS